MKPLVDHFALFNQMSSINRFSRDKMAKQENVLEHTGFVVLFCLFVSKALEAADGVQIFDRGRLLTRAAIHDVDEAVLGDIPRPTKYMSETTATEFKLAEERAVENICQFFNVENLFNSWVSAKDNSPEGRLVYLADLAAVAYTLWSEVSLYGNMSFMRVGSEMTALLIKLRRKDAGLPWEKAIIEELHTIVNDLRYADHGHPQLQSSLHLDSMLKEETKDGPQESIQNNEEIPF